MADTILIVDPLGEPPTALSKLPAHRALVVRSGSEALEGLHRSETVLLLVDERLESPSAVELVVCARTVRPGLPVAVMACPDNMDRAMERFGTTVTDYLLKPISSTALRWALRQRGGDKASNGMAGLAIRLAPVAHGIYGMLTALDGGLYQLESGLAANTPERIDAGLGTVRSASLRLRRLVLDILEVVRAEHLRVAPTDMGRVARAAVRTARSQARKAGIDIVEKISPVAGQAEVDAERFRSALERLLDVAVAETGGSVADGHRRVDFCLEPVGEERLRFDIRLAPGSAPSPEAAPGDGNDFDTALNRLGRFTACLLIRRQGGVIQGEETFSSTGWVIDLQRSAGKKPMDGETAAGGP